MTRSEALIQKLVEEYGYKPIPPMFSEQYRNIYRQDIPSFLHIEGSSDCLCDHHGVLICTGYKRIVVGDYGAFVEFEPEQANLKDFIVARGQEYRINDPRYAKNVKYHWLTTKGSNIKIYFQQKQVPYADYLVGMYYVSPFETKIKEEN